MQRNVIMRNWMLQEYPCNVFSNTTHRYNFFVKKIVFYHPYDLLMLQK